MARGFGAHFRQDADHLLAVQQHVVRPLDMGVDAFVFVDCFHDGDGRHEGALRCLFRQEGRPQDDTDPDTAAIRREPAAGQAALAACLLFRHDGHAVGTAFGSQLLTHFVCGIGCLHIVDMVADPVRMEMRHDFLRAQQVRGTPQDIPLFRYRFDFITQVFQRLDVLPDRCPGYAEPGGDFLPRNRLRRTGP